jgi:hypothetical protein
MRKFSILIILIISSVLFLGCITKKGTKVDIESIKPSDLIKQPNGTYKLKPRERTKIPIGIPYTPLPSNVKVTSLPIPIKSIASRPDPIEIKSAEANKSLALVKPSGKIAPFSPTVSKTPILPTAPIKDASNLKVNVIPITNTPPSKPDDWCGTDTTIKTEEEMKVNWPELWIFYLIAALALVAIWVSYKAYLDWKELKHSKELERSLKEPAIKAQPKKAKKRKKASPKRRK